MACFCAATLAWGFGFYGQSVDLAVPHETRGWPSVQIASATTVGHLAGARSTRNHGYLVYDTLYGMDQDLAVRPQMAAGHVIEDDGRRWVITLREGLRFHDGSPVLARDVVPSVKRFCARTRLARR